MIIPNKEAELYQPIKTYFESLGYEVKGEVHHCDLIALRSDQPNIAPIIVELKTSFNLTLLLQSIERLKLSPYVYVAVAKKKSTRNSHSISALCNLCKKIGVGFLLVTFYKKKMPFVELVCHPTSYVYEIRPSDKKEKQTRQTVRLVNEFTARSGDYHIAHGTKKFFITAYKEQALRVAIELQNGPQRTMIVRQRSGVGKASTILQRNYYHWFQRQSRGIYALTEKGWAAIQQYESIIAQFSLLLLRHK